MNRIDLNKPDLHISNFQNNSINNVDTNIGNKKIFVDLNNEKKLVDKSKLDIKSSEMYNFTLNDDELSNTNTKHLFKNLYGETQLTSLFFSKENIINLQNVIKMLVYKQMNYVIDNQSMINLQVVMRSIFLAYNEHPPYINDKMSIDQKKSILKLYTNETARLNELVINEIVPRICSELQQYLHYLKDSSRSLQTIPRSVNTSTSGTRTYRSITNVLTGSSL